MKVRIVEKIGGASGDTYWQIQKKHWWWSAWIDHGPLFRTLDAARDAAKIVAQPRIYYIKD